MNRIYSRLGLTTLALIAGSGVVAYAQDSTTGAITGTVLSPAGAPVANAKVTLDGGRGQIVRITDANGNFKASALIPGQYSITVTAAGYETSAKLTASASMNNLTPIRVSMPKAAGAVVEVVATTQTLDTTTVTSGTSITSDVFSTLPLGRSFAAVAAMAPGVVASGIDSSNPSIGGGSGLDNQYVIDGANTTNPGYGSSGSFSGTYGSLGSGINTDFIQEVQVKSFAMEAEYGQNIGGVITAITKSGSNNFEGSAFAYFDIDSLQARNKVPVLSGTPAPIFDGNSRTELGFTASGPIVKDKLFYFVGYNPIQDKTTYIAPHKADGTNYLLTGQKFDRKKKTDSYYAKLNWQITPDQQLEFSTFGDPGERPLGPQNNANFRQSVNTFSKLTFGSDTYTLKYNGIFFNDLLVEARYSNSQNKFTREITTAGDSQWAVTDSVGNANLSPNAAGLYEKSLKGENKQTELKLTKTLGNVELKVGYLHEDVTYNGATAARSGPAGFVDTHNGQAYSSGLAITKYYALATDLGSDAANLAAIQANPALAVPYYSVVRGNFSPVAAHTSTKYDAVFLQANTKLGNVNLKTGVRFEGQTLTGTDLTYKFKMSDNIAPRIGVTWDVEGNGKSKIYAFYGRYFEKIPNDIAVRALSTEQGVNQSDFQNINADFTSLSGPIANNVNINQVDPTTGKVTVIGPNAIDDANKKHFVTTGSFPTIILPGTKSAYQDELVFGYDLETSGGIQLSTRYIHRELGRIIEDISLDGDSYFIGNPGQNQDTIRKTINVVGTPAETAPATFPKPTRNYNAIEMTANKSSAKYSAFMNVKFSKLEGNYEGLFRGDNGQTDPNISSLYDLPVQKMGSAAKGLTGMEQFLIGALPTDRSLVVNLGYTYMFDMGLSLGILSKTQTGTPITSYLAHPVYKNAGEIPQYGRGTEGRLPTTYTFDTSAIYTYKMGGRKNLQFRADVFNVCNTQRITSLDTNVENNPTTPNPNYMKTTAWDTGRRVRLGVKFAF